MLPALVINNGTRGERESRVADRVLSCGRVEFERTTDFFTFVPNNWNGMKIALGDCTKQKKGRRRKKYGLTAL